MNKQSETNRDKTRLVRHQSKKRTNKARQRGTKRDRDKKRQKGTKLDRDKKKQKGTKMDRDKQLLLMIAALLLNGVCLCRSAGGS